MLTIICAAASYRQATIRFLLEFQGAGGLSLVCSNFRRSWLTNLVSVNRAALPATQIESEKNAASPDQCSRRNHVVAG